jgi:hypothetical protein
MPVNRFIQQAVNSGLAGYLAGIKRTTNELFSKSAASWQEDIFCLAERGPSVLALKHIPVRKGKLFRISKPHLFPSGGKSGFQISQG